MTISIVRFRYFLIYRPSVDWTLRRCYLFFVQVPVIVGAVIEGVATALCRLASRTLSDLQPRATTVIDSFIGTSLVVLGKCQTSHTRYHQIPDSNLIRFSIN